jgi:hypothetical protein
MSGMKRILHFGYLAGEKGEQPPQVDQQDRERDGDRSGRGSWSMGLSSVGAVVFLLPPLYPAAGPCSIPRSKEPKSRASTAAWAAVLAALCHAGDRHSARLTTNPWRAPGAQASSGGFGSPGSA